MGLLRVITRTLSAIVRFERWVVLTLAGLFAVSLFVLLWRFHRQNTILVPTTGGTYIEGSVGELLPLNPWFTVQNDVNRDIVSLVFAGLMKYNPETKKIEGDLATLQVSPDGRVYTAKLKDDLFWHDSTPENPHPVTSDDVVFTFATAQDPEFPGSLLRQNFRGVTLEKIDDRTVQFRLEEAYTFFPSNLTLGLLPKRSFTGIPVSKMDLTTDFGLSPIGAGPYKFKSLSQTELSTEITLERFERMLPPPYRLERVVFRIFPDYPTLLSDLRSLDGIRIVPHNEKGSPIVPSRFRARNYTLPQYVALFLNLDRKVLQDQKLRLGLQLGTNKQDIADTLGDAVIVDTPLLEIDTSDWRYQFDPKAAQGALFASQWYFPEKLRLQRLLERRDSSGVGILKIEPIALLDTGAVLTVTGPIEDLGANVRLNGVPIQRDPTASGTWVVALPTSGGTGSLKIGDNLLRLTEGKDGKRILDSTHVWRTTSIEEFERASEEQRLVELFVQSKNGAVPEAERITVDHLIVDRGFLRRRTPEDTIGIRTNDQGKSLTLTLVTSPSPETYERVARRIAQQWRLLGVEVKVEVPETMRQFQDRLLRRDYDVLLFGQSLLDNLDSYPYWHSSNVQSTSGDRNDLKLDAYNLSQYASFEADTLLETVRSTSNERERTEALRELREKLKEDVPAIFLYTPLSTFAHREDILGIELKNFSLHSDRFLTLYHWYVKQERVFKPGYNWWSFFGWILGLVN